jgi:hypothetical protein
MPGTDIAAWRLRGSVDIARRSEIALKIAAKIDRADQEYFDRGSPG